MHLHANAEPQSRPRLAVAISVQSGGDRALAEMLKQNLAARGCPEVDTEFGAAHLVEPAFAYLVMADLNRAISAWEKKSGKRSGVALDLFPLG